MKIKIMSDEHFEFNKEQGSRRNSYLNIFQQTYNTDDCDVIVHAGDTCATISGHKKYFDKFKDKTKKHIFVLGNHSVSPAYGASERIVQSLIEDYKKFFDNSENIILLHNESINIDNISFFGTILFTDYKYQINKNISKPISEIEDINMYIAMEGMNDFRAGYYVEDKTNNIYSLNPTHWRMEHDKALIAIKEWYDKERELNPNTKLVLITHHPMSIKAISPGFEESSLNGSFISDLEEWLRTNCPLIDIIVSGHVHSRTSFKIKTTGDHYIDYIINPFGYIFNGEPKRQPEFDPNLIVEI